MTGEIGMLSEIPVGLATSRRYESKEIFLFIPDVGSRIPSSSQFSQVSKLALAGQGIGCFLNQPNDLFPLYAGCEV
jgi:hypothetical protein